MVFAFSIYVFTYVGGEFFPSSDQGTISVEIEMPPGTPLTETDRALRRVEAVVGARPETETIYSTLGGGRRGVENASVIAQLQSLEKRGKGVSTLINELRTKLAAIPAADIRVARPGRGGGCRGRVTGARQADLVEGVLIRGLEGRGGED